MATQRLPISGGDNGAWGTILNGFLEVSHNADGTLQTTALTQASGIIASQVGQAGGVASLSNSGLVPTAQLGTSTASSSTYLRGDGTWNTPAAGVTLDSTASDIHALGTQAAGTNSQAARADHVHPTTGLLLTANNLTDVADAGSSRANLHIPMLTSAQATVLSNISLSSPGSGTFDGYTPVNGDVLLLTDQNTASQNGPWIYNGASSALTRPTDYANGAAVKGRSIQINAGTANGGSLWVMATTSAVTVDTTSTSWALAKASVGAGTYAPLSGAGQLVPTINLPPENLGVFFNRSAGTANNSEIFYMMNDGSEIRQITNNANYQTWWPKVSPDGSRILFLRAPVALTNYDSDYTQQSLWVTNIDGTNPVQIVAQGWAGAGTNLGVPNWTPDGREIVFFSGTGGLLYVVRSDGSNSPVNIPVSGFFGGITDPSVSPDSTMITFIYQYNVWTVSIFGGTPTQVTTGGSSSARYTDPNFSFDNQTILFLTQFVAADSTHAIGQWGLQTVAKDGTNQTTILNDGNGNSKGCWGEDGYIYFHRLYYGSPAGTNPDSHYSIAKIRSDGSGPVIRVTDGSVRDYMPDLHVSRFPRVPTRHADTHGPIGTDPIPWLSGVHAGGALASRPAAVFANAGYLYFATDTGQLYESNGTTWFPLAPATTTTAPLASPPFTGNPTAPTQASGDNTTKLATDAFVQAAVGQIPAKPTDFSFYGWTNDPELAGGAVSPVAGRLYLVRFRAVATATVGHLGLYVGLAGTSMTASSNFVGIYDTGQTTASTATLLGSSADQSTNFAAAAPYSVALTAQTTGSLALTSGQDYFVALLVNSTGTIPKFLSSPGTTLPQFANLGLAGLAARVVRSATTGLTTLSTTIGSGSMVLNDSTAYPYCVVILP